MIRFFIFCKTHWKWLISIVVSISVLVIAILTWQYPKNNHIQQEAQDTQETIQIFKGSVFDLEDKISSEKFTLNQTELVKKYNGLKVADTGYIDNVSKISNKLVVRIVKTYDGTIFDPKLDLESKPTTFPRYVSCLFDKKWEQTLSIANSSNEISFEGIIDSNDKHIQLKDCSIK